jgi:signal transduction histidine kinase
MIRSAERRGRLTTGGWAVSVSNAGSGEQPEDLARQDEAAALRASRRRLAEAGDAERRAIERDLHDGVQQHLVALSVNLQRLGTMVDADPVAANALLREMTGHVHEALAAATELARRIHLPLLDARGLASAIRAEATRAGLTVAVDVPASGRYSSELMDAIYWSCVTALGSASPGSEATVHVVDSGAAVTFEIRTVGALSQEPLERVRDRVEAFDGRVRTDTLPDGRTLLQGWLPLSR